MAQYLGTVQGTRGESSRVGSKGSGLVTTAASWDGAIRTTLRFDEATGLNHYRVEMIPWHGHGERRLIDEGSF